MRGCFLRPCAPNMLNRAMCAESRRCSDMDLFALVGVQMFLFACPISLLPAFRTNIWATLAQFYGVGRAFCFQFASRQGLKNPSQIWSICICDDWGTGHASGSLLPLMFPNLEPEKHGYSGVCKRLKIVYRLNSQYLLDSQLLFLADSDKHMFSLQFTCAHDFCTRWNTGPHMLLSHSINFNKILFI